MVNAEAPHKSSPTRLVASHIRLVGPPSSPSGFGIGAALYVVGPPCQGDRVSIWFHHGSWYGLTVHLVWPTDPTLADATALEPSALAVARKIYASL
jgi:hypothetical protein